MTHDRARAARAVRPPVVEAARAPAVAVGPRAPVVGPPVEPVSVSRPGHVVRPARRVRAVLAVAEGARRVRANGQPGDPRTVSGARARRVPRRVVTVGRAVTALLRVTSGQARRVRVVSDDSTRRRVAGTRARRVVVRARLGPVSDETTARTGALVVQRAEVHQLRVRIARLVATRAVPVAHHARTARRRTGRTDPRKTGRRAALPMVAPVRTDRAERAGPGPTGRAAVRVRTEAVAGVRAGSARIGRVRIVCGRTAVDRATAGPRVRVRIARLVATRVVRVAVRVRIARDRIVRGRGDRDRIVRDRSVGSGRRAVVPMAVRLRTGQAGRASRVSLVAPGRSGRAAGGRRVTAIAGVLRRETAGPLVSGVRPVLPVMPAVGPKAVTGLAEGARRVAGPTVVTGRWAGTPAGGPVASAQRSSVPGRSTTIRWCPKR
ncbi:MAG: hypothetical protein JWN00_879 [Actinomycetia bacterium]|nr:hypothetical protein [Actinomycetes bacterium]